jgi:hypothetical protein
VTLSEVDPAIVPSVAVIVVEPKDTLVAKPFLPDVLLMVALDDEEVQVTWVVIFCVLLSLYVPVAVNCSVEPTATDASLGVTAMDTKPVVVTVRSVDPFTDPRVAVIVVLPR